MQPRSPNRRHVQLIHYKDLLHGHAFSFRTQPYLSALFRDIRRADKEVPLTIIVGAGVSMESSLPSWGALVKAIASEVDDQDLVDFALRFTPDMARQAEIVQGMLAESVGLSSMAIGVAIRNALYPANVMATPGSLARSIATLVRSYPGEVHIITTNYDSILEDSLQQIETQCESLTLEDISQWKDRDRSTVSILHVHGYIPQSGDIRGPIVLTESQFLKHGSLVRETISECLETSLSVMIGLGFTDPNLIGALYQSRNTEPKNAMYALSVASQVAGDGEGEELSARFHVESARYLERLSVRPILLKSYSQLNQVVSDLNLALTKPAQYKHMKRDGRQDRNIAYGPRFQRLMNFCYQSVGCEDAPHIPSGKVARNISKRLARALQQPANFLNEMSGKYGLSHRGDQPECFQLCLWFRRLDLDGHPSYALDLMGSSAYQNREKWSLRRDVRISAESPYASAQAVYRGVPLSVNLDPQRNSGLLRGVYAVPIRIGTEEFLSDGIATDQVLVGALTLDSTYYVSDEHNDGTPVPKNQIGVIGQLGKTEMATLNDLLYAGVRGILLGN